MFSSLRRQEVDQCFELRCVERSAKVCWHRAGHCLKALCSICVGQQNPAPNCVFAQTRPNAVKGWPDGTAFITEFVTGKTLIAVEDFTRLERRRCRCGRCCTTFFRRCS